GGARVVVARHALGAVLGDRVTALGHLEPQIGVDEVRQAPARIGQERGHARAGAVDQIHGQRGRGQAHSVSKGSTVTCSPAATSPRLSPSTTKQLPATMENRRPEPCGPVVPTSPSPSRKPRTPRLYSVRPVFLRIGSSARARHVTGKSRRRPASL